VHPDSYRDRGQLFFIADYLEDFEVTEGTLLTTSDKKTTPVVTGVVNGI